MPTVRLPGGPSLSYREWGRPDGAVVLLLHGAGSNADTWKHVAPVLGERFRVIGLDARGHGGSEWTHDYSIELMRDDVVAFLDAIGVLAAIVIGHSMGGATAFLLAASHPELVRLLVLEEMPPPDAAKPPRPFPRHPDPDGGHDWRAIIAVRRWRNVAHPDWWEMAPTIKARTLVLGGQRSSMNQKRMRELAGAIPDATFTSVNLGHSIHTDLPSTFLAAVEPFVARFGK